MQLFQCFLNASCEIKIIYASLNIQKRYFFIIKLGEKDSINMICLMSVILAVCVSLIRFIPEFCQFKVPLRQNIVLLLTDKYILHHTKAITTTTNYQPL